MRMDMRLGLGSRVAAAAAAAAALEPPAGMTGWFKLDDATPGESDAFPAVANAGSVVEDWSRVATGVTLQTASGPNGMKFAQVAASSDEVVAGALTVGDFITVAKGTFAWIFRHTLSGTSTSHYSNIRLMRNSDVFLGVGGHEDGKISPFYRGGSLNYQLPIDYTSNTWRVLVMRWERGVVNKLFGKLDGDVAWSEVAIAQDLYAATGAIRLFDGSESATSGIAEFLAYDDQSEEIGDALMAYLVARGGF